MRPDDLLVWLRARPFRPFVLVTVSGETYEIRHPEWIKLLRTSLVIFTPTEADDVYDGAQMLNLTLIERIEPAVPAA
jgi:hypothetical protein